MDSTTATRSIVDALTKAIVEHRLHPGSKLAEQKLADHFGVSRTLVRQRLVCPKDSKSLARSYFEATESNMAATSVGFLAKSALLTA